MTEKMSETPFHRYVREQSRIYYPRLKKFARYLINDWNADDEELIHETIKAALEYRGEIHKGELKVLFRIMRNRFLMARDGTRIKTMMSGIKNGRECVYLEDDIKIKSVTKPVQENYVFLLEVFAGIENLSDVVKEAIILAAQGHVPSEIARILDIKDGTAASRLNKARKELRERTGERIEKKAVKNKSPYRGVARSTSSNRNPWLAKILVTKDGKRKRVHLGAFRTPQEAARAYDAAAIEHQGHRATLNFPAPPPLLSQSPR